MRRIHRHSDFHHLPALPTHGWQRKVLATAALLACTLAAAPPAHAQAAPGAAATQRYDIPAGPLDTALGRFGRTAGILIAADPQMTAGRTTAGLQGRHSVAQGLEQLLAGTGLQAMRTADGGYTLRPAAATGTAAAPPAARLGTVTVTAQAVGAETSEGTDSYAARASTSATRLQLTPRQTPQSLSVVTRQQMDDQGLTTVSDVLQQTPGITVNRDNTEGYSFYARGFQVENFQFDGVPSLATAGGNVRDNYSLTGSAIYDRMEILKGATGLVNGAGYPSGVINLVRKRPTAEFQGHASVSAGSWNDRRAELDLSTPITADGRIRGRLVAATKDGDSFIDHLKTSEDLVYGIVEADLAPATTLSLGVDVQRNRDDGTTNAHLPAFYSDGSMARFARHTNAADQWAYRNQDTQRLFATLEHQFNDDWHLKAQLGQRKYRSREVISGMASATIDVATHSLPHGFYQGGAAQFNTDTDEKSLDLQLSGAYQLLGRRHQLVMGYGAARTKSISRRSDGDTDTLISDVFAWNNNATQPTSYEWWSQFDVNARQKIAYAATVFKPADAWGLILGARVTDYTWSLLSVNALNRRSLTATKVSGKVIPYAGVTFDIDAQHTVYASYTDIFKPQAYSYDANDRQLDPLTGKSMEVGIKGSYFGGRLNASAALFQLKQDNYAALDPTGASRPGGGVAYVAIQGVKTRGLELEMSGEVLPGWQLNAGLTLIQPRDVDGQRVSPTQAEKNAKLATMFRLPGAWSRLSIGGNVQWQGDTYFTQTVAGAQRRFTQPAYGVVGLVAGYDVNRDLKITLNVNNLFDKAYYAGIGSYNSVYWGAPRNALLTARYRF